MSNLIMDNEAKRIGELLDKSDFMADISPAIRKEKAKIDIIYTNDMFYEVYRALLIEESSLANEYRTKLPNLFSIPDLPAREIKASEIYVIIKRCGMKHIPHKLINFINQMFMIRGYFKSNLTDILDIIVASRNNNVLELHSTDLIWYQTSKLINELFVNIYAYFLAYAQYKKESNENNKFLMIKKFEILKNFLKDKDLEKILDLINEIK